MKAKEGMRVKVFSPDKKKYLGEGTIRKVETLYIELGPGHLIPVSDNYPSEIVLDDGRVLEGIECWWIPVEDVKRVDGNDGD